MLFLSCVCYVFVRDCLYVICGHLLGKGWPLGSRLWCLTVSLSLYPGSGVVLDCIDSWSLHPYIFEIIWSLVQGKQMALWCVLEQDLPFTFVLIQLRETGNRRMTENLLTGRQRCTNTNKNLVTVKQKTVQKYFIFSKLFSLFPQTRK